MTEKIESSSVGLAQHLESQSQEKWTGKTLNEEARQHTITEHSLGVFQALKLYPKAVGWSLFISMSIVMEGYDTNLVRDPAKVMLILRLETFTDTPLLQQVRLLIPPYTYA